MYYKLDNELTLFETLKIGDQSYEYTEFAFMGDTLIGDDYSKSMLIFKMKGSEKCLLVPDLKTFGIWEQYRVSLEKNLMQMQTLGYKIQDYQFIDAILQTAHQSTPMKVILADDFEATCKNNSLIIYNNRDSPHAKLFVKPHGNYRFDYENILKNSEDREFVQEMFDQLIKEYAIAYLLQFNLNSYTANAAIAFELEQAPTSVLTKQHRALQQALPQLPTSLTQKYQGDIPRARYMAWDLIRNRPGQTTTLYYVSDLCFEPIKISTLEEFNEFKKDKQHRLKNYDNLPSLATMVAMSIAHFTEEKDGKLVSEKSFFLSDFEKTLAKNFKKAIDDDAYLKKALHYAATKVKELTGEQCINEAALGIPDTLISAKEMKPITPDVGTPEVEELTGEQCINKAALGIPDKLSSAKEMKPVTPDVYTPEVVAPNVPLLTNLLSTVGMFKQSFTLARGIAHGVNEQKSEPNSCTLM